MIDQNPRGEKRPADVIGVAVPRSSGDQGKIGQLLGRHLYPSDVAGNCVRTIQAGCGYSAMTLHD
jgi:hypothetical protein